MLGAKKDSEELGRIIARNRKDGWLGARKASKGLGRIDRSWEELQAARKDC